jgi:hypothetical protein
MIPDMYTGEKLALAHRYKTGDILDNAWHQAETA